MSAEQVIRQVDASLFDYHLASMVESPSDQQPVVTICGVVASRVADTPMWVAEGVEVRWGLDFKRTMCPRCLDNFAERGSSR